MNHPTPHIPPRDLEGHKGTFGTVAVLGGAAANRPDQPRMIGGPAITALAALRAGVGLAKLLLPEPIANHALTITPSATAIPLPTTPAGHIDHHATLPILDATLNELRKPPSTKPGIGVLAIGPGLGPPTEHTRALLFRAISQDAVPVVIDADALNALATIPHANRDFRAHAVLTPHPGEADRLIHAFNLHADPTAPNDHERQHAAQAIAAYLGCICILKSHRTAIASPVEARTLDAPPNPALATAGSGDVLTGVVAAFIAQFTRSALLAGEHTRASQDLGGLASLDAAHAAAHAHAHAAHLWAHATTPPRTAGLLATELADRLPAAIAQQRAQSPGQPTNPTPTAADQTA